MLENMNEYDSIDYEELKKELKQNLDSGNINTALSVAEYYVYKA